MMMESNLSFQTYKNHIKFMREHHDDIRSTTHPKRICGVSNTNNIKIRRRQ